MSNLNKSQQEAVEYNSGPLLIVAGAGTGKTTVITQKIAHLIEKNLAKPENILALTFTDKAAGEMQERVDEMLETGYVDLQISTFHAFCQRILEEYGAEMGLPTRFKLLSQTDAWLLMKKHLYDFNLDYYRPLGSPTGQIHTLLSHFSKAKDELISPEEYLKYAENLKLDKDEAEIQEKSRITELANAYHIYNQLLLDNNCLDFGDLMYYTVKLLEKRPNVLKLLQERFTHILVDEFQDVNWVQYRLVQQLTTNNQQLTVVGDDDQSIYSFRGSNVSLIMKFMEDYKGAKNIVLNENYRSGQEILDFAYNSIQHNNPERLEEKLSIDKKLKSKVKSQKSKVILLHSQTLDQEVQSVIENIQKIMDTEKDATLDDIAILVRANAHVEPFVGALESAGIPYEYIASTGLYRQPIVLDSMSFLQLLGYIYDDRAIYRLLRMPFFEMSENDILKITAFAKKKSISYYEGLKRGKEFHLSSEGMKIADKVIALIHEGMKRARYEKPMSVLYQFLEDSGYLKYLAHGEQEGNRDVVRQIYHVGQLFDMIKDFEAVIPDAHVNEFVEHYNAIIESGDSGKMNNNLEDTPDSVNIITVHSAKGLEYKYVFVVNLVEERFPTRRKGGSIELPEELLKDALPDNDFHYMEERRLFYVAVTRAKEKLFLTSADDYGGSRKKKVSRFITELELESEVGVNKTDVLHGGNLSGLKATSPYKGEGNKVDFEYTPPKKFSFSQINSYLRCPYQYKLAHILKIPMKGSASFSFGNTIHNTLHKFYKRIQELNGAKQDSLFGLPQERETNNSNGIKVPTEKELLELYEKSWVTDWYESKNQREEYYEKGKELLKIFYSAQDGNWTIPVSLEGWFQIKVGEYTVHGRMDRIDKLEDGTLEIIDYKTGKSKDKLTTDDKQQLLIYQIAVETLPEYHHIGSVGKLTFYYVNDNLRTSFEGKQKDIEKLQEKILDTITSINRGKFKATPGPHVCKYCDFKEICEFRKL